MNKSAYFSELYTQIQYIKKLEKEYANVLISENVDNYYLNMIRSGEYLKNLFDAKNNLMLLIIRMLKEEYPDIQI